MMNNFNRFASLLALAALASPVAAQPRTAALETSAGPAAEQTFMFTGATVRLSLDRRGDRRPELAMRFAGGIGGAGLMPRIGEGFAFSARPGAKPSLSLAGQDSRVLGKRLHMSDGAKAALVVGGVVLLAAVVAVAASGAGDAPAAFWDED